jgi:hypothetical protein
VDNASAQNLATLYGVLWWGNTEDTSGTVFAFDELSGDPSFVDADGGNYHINPISAAIDAGRDDAGVTSDVDWETRPHYNGYDLGADEWWPLVTVKSASTGTVQPGDVVTNTLLLTNATATPIGVP